MPCSEAVPSPKPSTWLIHQLDAVWELATFDRLTCLAQSISIDAEMEFHKTKSGVSQPAD